jgi:hypothetical protein
MFMHTQLSLATSSGCTAAPYHPLHALSPAGIAQTAPVPIRIAFFNVEVCNSGWAVPDSAKLTQTLYSDPHSLKNYWRAASNNRAFMDETTSAVINLKLPCDRFPIDSCALSNWFNYARDNPGALGGRVFSNYQFQVRAVGWKQLGSLHPLSRMAWHDGMDTRGVFDIPHTPCRIAPVPCMHATLEVQCISCAFKHHVRGACAWCDMV